MTRREKEDKGERAGSVTPSSLSHQCPSLRHTQPNPAFDAAWPAAPDGNEAAGPAWEAVDPSLVWSCVGSSAATSAPSPALAPASVLPPPQSVFAFPAAAEARPAPPAKPLAEDAVPAPIALAECSAPSLGLLPALVRPASFLYSLCAVRSLSAPLSPPRSHSTSSPSLSLQTPSSLNLSFTPARKPSLAMPGADATATRPKPRVAALAAFAPGGGGGAPPPKPLSAVVVAWPPTPPAEEVPQEEACLAETWLVAAGLEEEKEKGEEAVQPPPPAEPAAPAAPSPAPAPPPPPPPGSPTTAALRAELAALRARGPLATLPAPDVARFIDIKMALAATRARVPLKGRAAPVRRAPAGPAGPARKPPLGLAPRPAAPGRAVASGPTGWRRA